VADARQIAQLLEAPQGGAFGTMSPQEQGAVSPSILDKIVSSLMNSMATLPKRAIDASAQDISHLGDPDYQRQSIGPALETAFNMVGGAGAVPAEANTLRSGIKAYHGSPHSFEKFDAAKIGTGEGEQAFGHGLYFSDAEAVAKGYRDKLAADKGHMYEVNINADPAHFLNLDGRLGEQSQAVQNAFKSQMERFGPDARMQPQMMIAASRHPQGMSGVSQDLASQGVPGVKYLDQFSRGAGEGSSNYVVFDDKLIDIMKKYGLAGAVPTGLMGLGAAQEDRL